MDDKKAKEKTKVLRGLKLRQKETIEKINELLEFKISHQKQTA